MKIFEVVHTYDEDGSYGDVITEEVVARFASAELAAEFCNKYSLPHVYNNLYDDPRYDLCCGLLSVREIDILESIPEHHEGDNMWWLEDEVLEQITVEEE